MGTQPETLGIYLKRVRESRGLTLRRVEVITNGKVSNAYLSQLESGRIASPSVLMLHRLSAAYAIEFAELCELDSAGNPTPTPPPTCPTCGQVLP